MTRGLGAGTGGIGENHIGCLLGDHIDRADDEKPRDARKDRRIDDPQSPGVMDAEIAAEHTILFPGPNGTGTGGMMSPRIVADELSKVVIGLHVVSREFFLGNELLLLEFGRHHPDKLDAIDDGVQIFLCRIVPFIEVPEVDNWRVTGIVGPQGHLACPKP